MSAASSAAEPLVSGAGGAQRCLDLLGEAVEALLGEGVQESLPVDEVAAWRPVADPGTVGELTQRQPVDAAVPQHLLGVLKQDRAQVPVVEGPRHHDAILLESLDVAYFLDAA